MAELPYQAEYAKSGRAGCKACKQKIDQGTLRIAIMVQVTCSIFLLHLNNITIDYFYLQFLGFHTYNIIINTYGKETKLALSTNPKTCSTLMQYLPAG